MTSGTTGGEQLSQTETLKIGNDSEPPQNPDHPRKLDAVTGGFLNKDFLTCGGFNSVEGTTDKCYMLGSEGPFATMMIKRALAASIVLNDQTMWILGGSSSSGISHISTEYMFRNGTNKEGPPMPLPLSHHTMAKINQTTSFLVGGWTGYVISKKSWYYKGKWIEGPDLKIARYGHSLGIIRDSVTLLEYVVTAGGYAGSDTNDVEIMRVDATSWETGKL